MFKPKFQEKFTLTATLKGKPEGGKSKFDIEWVEDHDDFKGKANLDERAPTIDKCPEWQELDGPIKSNKVKIEAESTVPHDAWGSDTSAREIYACIRAEYKFIVKEGYDKIESRVRSGQGIDHLFVPGGGGGGELGKERAIIVESKTISDLSQVKRLIQDRKPDALLGVLGKGREIGVDPNTDKLLFATQMSVVWVDNCLDELMAVAKGARKKAVQKVWTDSDNDKPPHRVLNIYGGLDWNAKDLYDKLVKIAKKQYRKLKKSEKPDESDPRTLPNKVTASKYQRGSDVPTGKPQLLFIEKDWVTMDPEKGRFYLLPGKYQLRVRAEQFTGLELKAQEVDFADDKYRDDEFFYIDGLDKKTLAEFEKLKRKDRPEPGDTPTGPKGKRIKK